MQTHLDPSAPHDKSNGMVISEYTWNRYAEMSHDLKFMTAARNPDILDAAVIYAEPIQAAKFLPPEVRDVMAGYGQRIAYVDFLLRRPGAPTTSRAALVDRLRFELEGVADGIVFYIHLENGKSWNAVGAMWNAEILPAVIDYGSTRTGMETKFAWGFAPFSREKRAELGRLPRREAGMVAAQFGKDGVPSARESASFAEIRRATQQFLAHAKAPNDIAATTEWGIAQGRLMRRFSNYAEIVTAIRQQRPPPSPLIREDAPQE